MCVTRRARPFFMTEVTLASQFDTYITTHKLLLVYPPYMYSHTLCCYRRYQPTRICNFLYAIMPIVAAVNSNSVNRVSAERAFERPSVTMECSYHFQRACEGSRAKVCKVEHKYIWHVLRSARLSKDKFATFTVKVQTRNNKETTMCAKKNGIDSFEHSAKKKRRPGRFVRLKISSHFLSGRVV